MDTRSRGISDEELFMSRPNEGGDSPTVEPLRIFKPQSPKPAADKASDRFRYPTPTSSSTSSRPTFPLPPGASSSANPLPYPDDEDHRFSQPSKQTRPPYSEEGRKTSSSSYNYASPTGSQGSGGHNETSPRLNLSPVDKKPGLAERRGNVPAALSPTSPSEDKEDLFAKPLSQQPAPKISTSYQQKPYYPPPGGASSSGPGNAGRQNAGSDTLKMPQDSGMNRFASTASNSTTRASRGSPPPPETPIVEPGNIPGGGIEARYAAAGISGTATLNSFQPQSSAAAQRLAQYGGQPPAAPQPARPWTPTESPDQQPHGPPTVYQGANPVSSPPQHPAELPAQHSGSSSSQPGSLQVSVLEQDFQRMQASTPPPAYTSVNPNGGSSYPNEKQRPQAQASSSSQSVPTTSTATSSAAAPAPAPAPQDSKQSIPNPLASPALQHPGHPAFANDPKPEAGPNGHPALSHTPSVMAGQGPASPPPLPEGWIAHLDQNSGQYYYIHLATQATQWEFPKGPNPIHHDAAPLSPTASTYGNPLGSPFLGGKQSLASPLYPPQTPGYAESIMSVAASQTPSAAGFMGPPPSAGVDMYKIAPTNGVYFGPYLRYVNMDVEKGIWLGSILIVTDAPQPPTIHIHLSVDLSPNPRQLVPHSIYTHQRWSFYKYDLDLQMGEGGSERWTYAVTSHMGCTRYEFVVAGRHEPGWRLVAHSGNDFTPATSQAERGRLGGVGFMWKDVLQKNVDCGGFHVQLGLGGQIYGDRLWKEVPLLKQWLAMQGRENRKNAQWTARHEEDVTHAYFHYYTSHFDQPFLREAFAQIPHILQLDDHDIFDGFGSYPEYMQQSAIFKNIGRVAIEMYLLFQHHTTVEILRNVSSDLDLFTITGNGWHFVKYLGPAVVVVGPDCRSERTQARVMAGPTYQGIFPKVAVLPPSVQHCIWMVSVPLVYPRLDTVETLANTFATGKKAVNTTYNLLGKVTSSVAGVVGGKEVVAQGFSQVKKAVGKGGLMGNVFNQFGDLDIAEELKDLWTHESKDLERTYLIRTLQGIAQQKGIRMTFLSGDVNSCGAGLVHDPAHPSDHKTMYQVITSPIVASPAGNYMLKMLHNNRLLYVPQNGHRSSSHHTGSSSSSSQQESSDTKEDMMEIFQVDASGAPREMKKLMGRRNYVAIVAYDPEAVAGTGYAAASVSGQQGLQSKLSLAVDFVVQGDGAFNGPTKYGPVIVPHLEYGH
ncbi:uncharacterized protein E0L32_000560 [Thyridium curvatum]|uniref:WW domain-containing protein n=1 Tax=Thyridium curvatum TaxID=1093900 RepID=A0A507B506_9PEZI|nr:uncharacterized protein E0L32_000560 [Thyridium curvatum]TPX14166.1 hypothetical protein E0L32_000560 [Thyridium curvatum]